MREGLERGGRRAGVDAVEARLELDARDCGALGATTSSAGHGAVWPDLVVDLQRPLLSAGEEQVRTRTVTGIEARLC